LELDYIEVAAYRTPVRALALVDRGTGTFLAWIHHRDYTWDVVAAGGQLEPLNFSLQVPTMPPGVYRVSFWDTLSGAVLVKKLSR